MPLSITSTKNELFSYAEMDSHKDVTFVTYDKPITFVHHGKIRNVEGRKNYMARYEFLMDEYVILHTPKKEYHIIDYVYGL